MPTITTPSVRPAVPVRISKFSNDGTYQLIVNGGEWTHGEIVGPYHFVFQGGKLAK